MRKALLFLCLLSFGFCGYSQETEQIATPQDEASYTGKNEFKLNALYMLLGFPEFSYERILNEESAIGVSLAFAIDDFLDINFMAIPYYRIYFGDKPAAGFFVEGNAALYIVDDYEYIYYDDYAYDRKESNEVGAGLGVAVGAKFLSKGGWGFEVFGGAGRNFISADEVGPVYPRLGLTVGKRF